MAERPTVLYLHVPKAGGTTLSGWLFEQLHDPAQPRAASRWLRSGVYYYPAGFVSAALGVPREEMHAAIARPEVRAVLGHFAFGLHEALPRPSTYITMRREPVRRVVSLYRFQKLVQRCQGSHGGITIPDDMTLEAFVETPPYPEVDNGQCRRLAAWPAGQRCDARTLERAKRNLASHFCAVGLTERFDESLLLYCRALGLSTHVLYYPQNVTAAREEADPPAQALAAVRERNALDLALYAHARSLFDAAIAAGGGRFADELAAFRARKRQFFRESGWDMPARLR